MRSVLFPVLCAIVLPCSAAQGMRAIPQAPDTRAVARVASPNHLPSGQLAKASIGPARVPADALRLQSSDGKTVGRYTGDAVVLPYKDQMLSLPVANDFDEQARLPRSGGFVWASLGLYYRSTDCTGTPYFWTSSFGTRYNGVTVRDQGKYFAYIGEPAAAQLITVQSFYDVANSACYPYSSPEQAFMPLGDVVELTPLGAPPFLFR